jgi:hypothetical protein
MMERERAILAVSSLTLALGIAALLIVSARQRAADARRNLDAIMVFADPSHCRPGEPLAGILNGLSFSDERTYRPRAGAPIAVAGFPAPLQPRLRRRFGVGRDAMGFMTFAELKLRGRWHGLAVSRLRTPAGYVGIDSFEIHFDERPQLVRDTLARAGFPLPAVDEWRQADYLLPAPTPMMSVQSEHGGATLYCAR